VEAKYPTATYPPSEVAATPRNQSTLFPP
jgi:hypothetical protein